MAISTQARSAFDLLSTYIHLKDEGNAVPVEVKDDFWNQIDSRDDLHDGRLLCTLQLTETFPTWEMHPAGDEILYLLSGAIEVVLEGASQDDPEEQRVELHDRAACIVPQGRWHQIIVHRPSEVLFITPSKGTQHRPV